MPKLTPANWWYYFDRQGKGTAKCKVAGCAYTKEMTASHSTNALSSHLKHHHPKLFQQREDSVAEEKAKQQKNTLNANPLKKAFANARPSTSNLEDELPAEKDNTLTPPILLSLNATKKGPWDKDGPSTTKANCALMQMLATQLLPFNLVDGSGFQRFVASLQPKYKVPGRKHFSQYELPQHFDDMKSFMIKTIEKIDYIALTTDGWTSSDNKHSLISLTAHYLDQKCRPKFYVISAKPIKGRHTAEAIVIFIREALNEFNINEQKIVSVTRDTENTMKKVTRDLGFHSIDCTAHVIQLCLKNGLRNMDEQGQLQTLIEKVKKFVRKVRKSRVLSEELTAFQSDKELPKTVLVKNVEVRWNSIFLMLDRFAQNRIVINLMSAEHHALPTFSADEWRLLASVKSILAPIHEATQLLQDRNSSISTIIPLFKALLFALKEDDGGRFQCIKKGISDCFESRLREAEDRKDLVLATLLDPRFKTLYFDALRIEEYRQWLIDEAKQLSRNNDTDFLLDENANACTSASGGDDLFSRFETAAQSDALYIEPSPSPSDLEARQKAEVEVTDYLRDSKMKSKTDPFVYWESNSQKWPLLGKLVRKFHTPPATSSESERLFSTAGLISNDLRKSLSPENLAMLLFLHHNLLLTDFCVKNQ